MAEKLIDSLSEYCKTAIPMHMPGHKRNTEINGAEYLKRLSADIDITEIDGFDDLNMPSGILKESMERASRLFMSERSYYLVGGSTEGILASVYSLIKGSDKIICARNSHRSFYNALEITGAEPCFIIPETDEETGAFGKITPMQVEEALLQNRDVKAVFITSPTYEGIISDIKGISEICRKYNVKLIVDEAHGAHLGLFGVFGKSAVMLGADIAIQSLHKTLPSLTQTAIAHIGKGISEEERINFERSLRIFSTSSPSYLLISSIDSCAAFLSEKGEKVLTEWKERNVRFFEKTDKLKKLKVFHSSDRDISKIVISVKNTDITGNELSEILRREFNIETEMSSIDYVIAMTGALDTEYSMDILFSSLEKIDGRIGSGNKNALLKYNLPERKYDPKDALSKETEEVFLSDSQGRVAGEYIWAYPPGIPIVIPGEVIGEEIKALIASYSDSNVPLYSDKRSRLAKPCKILALKY